MSQRLNEHRAKSVMDTPFLHCLQPNWSNTKNIVFLVWFKLALVAHFLNDKPRRFQNNCGFTRGPGEAGQRTDAHLTDPSTDQPTNRPTESDRKIPRHPIEKLYNGPIRFLASVKSFNDAIEPNRKFGPMTQFKQIFFTFLLGICQHSAP